MNCIAVPIHQTETPNKEIAMPVPNRATVLCSYIPSAYLDERPISRRSRTLVVLSILTLGVVALLALTP
jgi:hypothetical protein